MSDNLKIKEPQDGKKINKNEPYEVRYWSQKLGVTEAKLIAAVKAVGPDVNKVKRYLGK